MSRVRLGRGLRASHNNRLSRSRHHLTIRYVYGRPRLDQQHPVEIQLQRIMWNFILLVAARISLFEEECGKRDVFDKLIDVCTHALSSRETYPEKQLVPVLRHLEKHLWINTAALRGVLHCDTGFFQHSFTLFLTLRKRKKRLRVISVICGE